MDDRRFMPTELAIATIVTENGLNTLSAVAAALSDDMVKVQPIQISRYINGSKMSRKVAAKVLEIFNIEVTDATGSRGSFVEQCKQEIIRAKSQGEL